MTNDPEFDKLATEIANSFIERNPNLCAQFARPAHQSMDDDLFNAMLAFIRDTNKAKSLTEAVNIIRKIRRLVRERAGLPVDTSSTF